VCILLVVSDLAVWALTGGGYFWPMWQALGLAVIFGLHAWIAGRPPGKRERELAARLTTLSQSRRDVVDRQAAELKRVERDLHDGAVYFAVAECLTNVVKHTGATSAGVAFTDHPGGLRLTVTDNGAGGADPARGTGLRGIIERLDAVDAVLDVVNPPGGPTRITITVPLAG
jgi:signal transduction histidine kinase